MAKEKILVVDDEKAINKLVCSYLTKEQFRPFPAYTGEEALDLLKKENPDLIILDIMLPDTEEPHFHWRSGSIPMHRSSFSAARPRKSIRSSRFLPAETIT